MPSASTLFNEAPLAVSRAASFDSLAAGVSGGECNAEIVGVPRGDGRPDDSWVG